MFNGFYVLNKGLLSTWCGHVLGVRFSVKKFFLKRDVLASLK